MEINGNVAVTSIGHKWIERSDMTMIDDTAFAELQAQEVRCYKAATKAMLINIGAQFGPEMAESIFMDALHEIANGAVGWEANEASRG